MRRFWIRRRKTQLLWKSNQSRRDKMVGRILRHEDLLKKIIEGYVGGHVRKGIPRAKYTNQIREDINKENCKDL